MSVTPKNQNAYQQQLSQAEATIRELRQIIDKQKRQIEHLQLGRDSKLQLKSNLGFLDTCPRKGVWYHTVSGGRAGTVGR